jgi:hypothetical protein
MPLTTTPDLQRFYYQGENEFCADKQFLVDRLSVATVRGQSNYSLPDFVLSIRRITWLGQKLDPLTKRNEREVFQSATQQGTPFWYVFNNIGANLISFFPQPLLNLNAAPNCWTSDNIANYVIVEFYRSTDNVSFVIPSWKRRQLLKNYVAYRQAIQDGGSYSRTVANYYKSKWDTAKAFFVDTLDDLYGSARKLMVDEIVSSNYFPGEPVLPINQFGVSVDEGY